jgi:hypothetical protein
VGHYSIPCIRGSVLTGNAVRPAIPLRRPTPSGPAYSGARLPSAGQRGSGEGASCKGKTGGRGGSTAGEYRQCTYNCGFGKVAIQHLVELLEDRWLRPVVIGPCAPGWLPPSSKSPRDKDHPPCEVLGINNTVDCGTQDEPILRSTTLNLHLTVRRKPLI